MPSALTCAACAVAATLVWGIIGFALARRIVPASLAAPIAPALGWACHSALALPLLSVTGLTWWMGATALLVPAAIAAALTRPWQRAQRDRTTAYLPAWAWAICIVLAVVPVLGLFPKFDGDAIAFAGPIFDHSKIALIDEMVRAGVPPQNPVFGEAGRAPFVAYYYLWHFSAAELGAATGMTGWEADAVLTGFTAFSSLLVISGVAVWLSGRAAAGYLAPPLAFAASMRPVLSHVLGADTYGRIFEPPSGFAGWLFQTSWAPQHVASASCVVLAGLLIVRLANAPSLLGTVSTALVVAAGFQSSIWVGGVTLVGVTPFLAAILIAETPKPARARTALMAAAAAALSLALVYPLLSAQFAIAAARQIRHPIAVSLYPVLSESLPAALRTSINEPAYWFVFLPVEFPAIYLPGLAALIGCLRSTAVLREQRGAVAALGALTLVSLLAAGHLTLTFAENNDLGWRSVLPAILVLASFASAGLAEWLTAKRRLAVAAVVVLFAASLPGTVQLSRQTAWEPTPETGRMFARTPELWAAVRRHAGPTERVANNPSFMADITPWPVNLSWALFADRRSCYAGHNLAVAFAPLSEARSREIGDQFSRVFEGRPADRDLIDLAHRYQCRVIVVTPEDGAWAADPFAASGLYRKVEDRTGRWRIYRAVE